VPAAFPGVRRAHISRRNVAFYETYRRSTASIYRSPLAAGARLGREVCPSPPRGKTRQKEPPAQERCGSIDCRCYCAVCHNMCGTNPISRLPIGGGRLGRTPEAKCAKRTQFPPGGQGEGGERRLTASLQACETNPIWSGRSGCRRVNVQNKAKLGWTGVCG
jgi:hypothetical protein